MTETRKISIPHCYIWMTKDVQQDRKKLYERYVDGYIRNTHPGWCLQKVVNRGTKAICEKIDGKEES